MAQLSLIPLVGLSLTLYNLFSPVASSANDIAQEFPYVIRVYKNGTVQRLSGTDTVPPSLDPLTGVQSKDVVVSPHTGVSARLYIPKSISISKSNTSDQKLPLLIYFHGGGFCIESASSPAYHSYLNSLVAKANVVAVSVNYRLAPEHQLPTAYDDSWVALKWVFGDSPDPWLTHHADFQRVFLAGDSAGGNIAHNMAIRAGSGKPDGVELLGIVMINPSIWGKDPTAGEAANPQMKSYIDKLWKLVDRASGPDDPIINLVKNPRLSELGCKRVLVCVAEKDIMRERQWGYYKALRKSGWGGVVKLMETKGEDHVFHFFKPKSKKAAALLKRVASFLNMDKP